MIALRGRGRKYRLLRGIVSLLILRYLVEDEQCGYGLRKRISEILGEALPPGYIYVMLKTLRKRGLVEGRESSRKGRRIVYYKITEKGREFLVNHRGAVEAGRRAIDELTNFMDDMAKGEEGRGKEKGDLRAKTE
ncbi:PadR family transcriptional regulator [Conexivisphaera calida]|uniref:Transcriptional regulator, PadR family n=1 Tax=Conexivisphaera calida TaxID=1874277 RepID=A0A4P2VBR7_9ARCH|nr:PadR family transcriptional regulator [Conexivisphaera calida]BBE41976.1 Transcriptional regulator, PadR family [Conexivisphaera calida]